MTTSRKAALDILTRVEKEGSYSNLALDSFISRSGVTQKDAALATALVYGVLENQICLDYFISHFAKRDAAKLQMNLRNILRLGAYQLIFMNKIPDSAAVNESVILSKGAGCAYASGFVNAVLREISRSDSKLPFPDKETDYISHLNIKYSCPIWLIEKWIAGYGREITEGLLESLSLRPPVAVRVNTLKTTPEGLINIFHDENIGAKKSAIAENGLELERLPDIRSLDSFKQGFFVMQDYASQLCCIAVDARAGETVFDMCAAPGGKSFTLGFLMGGIGSITALELHEHRLKLISAGAKRLGLELIKTQLNDSSKHNEELGLADRVLCDVPCSGLGVIRRKPEIRYKDPQIFDDLPNLQYSILCEGAEHLRKGGTLVYSTCTLNPDENEGVVKKFLAQNKDYELFPLPEGFAGVLQNDGSITLFPHINGTDGFFIARFKRKD